MEHIAWVEVQGKPECLVVADSSMLLALRCYQLIRKGRQDGLTVCVEFFSEPLDNSPSSSS